MLCHQQVECYQHPCILGEEPQYFRASGGDIFAIIIALIVTLSIKWIGILLINALLILPAASSRNISENMQEYHLYAVIFSLFSGIVGWSFLDFTNVATGPMIVIVASVIYFATYFYGKNK